MLTLHSASELIRNAIGQLKENALRIELTVIRSCEWSFAHPANLVSGMGAHDFGGRYNPPGIRAVYASFSDLGAATERNRGMLGFEKAPRVTTDVSVQLACVIRDHDIAQRLNVDLQVFRHGDWRKSQEENKEEFITQAIGRICVEMQIQAILYGSARSAATENLVWYPDHVPDTYITVHHHAILSQIDPLNGNSVK